MSEMITGEEGFEKLVRQTIERLCQEGYQSPFHMAAVGKNGAMVYYRFTVRDDPLQGTGVDAEVLANYPQDVKTEMKKPMNLLWVDARGEMWHMVITPGERLRPPPN